MKPVSVSGFKGLNNRLDPTALGLEWQLEASNVLCDDASYLVQRPGSATFLSNVADVHGMGDGRLFVVDTSGTLFEVASDGTTRTRATGFTGAPFQWAELGYALFALSETTAWCIYPDRVVPWGIPTLDAPNVSIVAGALVAGTYLIACVLIASDGRRGGCIGVAEITVAVGQGLRIDAPDTAGYTTIAYLSTPDGDQLYQAGALVAGTLTLNTNPAEGPRLEALHCYPPPNGLVSAHGNRLCAAVWEPEHNRGVLYWSKPDAPHLFELETDYQLVAGRPLLLTSVGNTLLVGTDCVIQAYPVGAPRQVLADYGALPDTAQRLDSGQVLFWTDRGLCRFPPFENLTEAALVPDNRSLTTGALLQHAGSSYYITTQRGEVRGRAPLAPYTSLSVTVKTGV